MIKDPKAYAKVIFELNGYGDTKEACNAERRAAVIEAARYFPQIPARFFVDVASELEIIIAASSGKN